MGSQIQTLQKEGCEEMYAEKFTGTKTDRPKFQELVSILQTGDTLVVTKLDRFARSTVDAIQIIQTLFEKGIKVPILNMGLIADTPTGRLVFHVMSAFAAFERDMIVERTQEGKAIAKLHPNFREGRPKKCNQKQIEHALFLFHPHSYKEVEEKTGISKRTLVRAKRKQMKTRNPQP
ncbi:MULTISPECIES: recombinase family protein [Bacillus]|uniref:recombinase family protein n=1 Tax=Bacillus TaxID=1386 RepID=UPI0020C96525|nr:recombinase family protein [Bacillus cereus]